MSVRIDEDGDRLVVAVPRLPRVAAPVAWLAASLAWPPVGFALARWRDLEGGAALALAVLPCLLVLVACADRIVRALSSRPLVLCWRGARVQAGSAPPLDPDGFAVLLAARRRWTGRTVHVLRLTARVPVRQVVLQLELLVLELEDAERARDVATALTRFLHRA